MQKTIDFLKAKLGNFSPACAIILGTGLGALADDVQNKVEIPYEQIHGFVKSTAPSHSGKLIAGFVEGVPVIVYKGRFHYYEGWSMQQVVYPVRIARLLGAKTLFVTNAAGSLNIDMKPGQLVRIADHINMMGVNPLIGKNTLDEPVTIDGVQKYELGDRFVSMHETYDAQIVELAHKIAREHGISLKDGVYCAVSGPTFETKAECLMFKQLGADVVGMSTVPEVIAAVHCGMKVFGVSVVTNLSNIFHTEPHSQEEIQENADKAGRDLLFLIKNIIKEVTNG